jgi:hypothetical protein
LYAVFSPNTCCISCPSHPPWLDHCNFIWRRVQAITSTLGWDKLSTSRPVRFTHMRRAAVSTGQMDMNQRRSGDGGEKKNILTLLGIQSSSLCPSHYSCWLRSPGFY